jgi:hypothetical protein
MKKLGVLLVIMFSFLAVSAQNELPIDEKTGKVTFTEVVDASGLTGKQIFDLTKAWGLKQGFTVIEETDGSKIKFNASVKVYYPAPKSGPIEEGVVAFSFFVGCKDGKFRYILTDYSHTGKKRSTNGGKIESSKPACGMTTMSSRGWVTIKNESKKNTDKLLTDLKRVIKEDQNDPEKNDDW